VAGELGVGILPLSDSEATRSKIAAFCDALGQALGRPVTPRRTADYRELVDALEAGEVSIAWLPPVAAARGVRDGTLRAAAVAVRSGAAGYSTALITPAGSEIRRAADLDGARVAWVDDGSAGGYLVIRAALREAGVDLDRAFAREEFVHSHSAVAQAVLEGRADVGATYFSFHPGTTQIARASWKELAGPTGSVRILAHAGPIPSDLLAVHRGVDELIFRQIQTALVDGHPPRVAEVARDLFSADGFAEPTNEHLAMLRGLLAAVDVPAAWLPRAPSTPPTN
jgi:phosphonate transport system substrate-binding protein